MRLRSTLAGIAAILLLSACGGPADVTPQSQVQDLQAGPETEFGFMEPMAQSGIFEDRSFAIREAGQTQRKVEAYALDLAAGDPSSSIPVSPPQQIAYSYDFGFRVSADDIEALQKRHVAMCESLKSNCRVLSMAKAGNDEYGYGELKLEVEATAARRFGDGLKKTTEGLDAEEISFGTSSEDLTDSIIDSEAHLASRRLLRERLMEVLRNRNGSVGDLVKAEEAVANVNEEIDAATQRLASLRGRVSFSDVDITYDPQLGRYTVGFFPPIQSAFTQVGTTLGVTIAAIIYATVALIPIIAFFLMVRWLLRKAGVRIWRRKKAVNAPEQAAE